MRRLLMLSALVTLGFALLCATVIVQDRAAARDQAARAADTIAAAVAQDLGRAIAQYDLSLQAVAQGLRLPGLWDLSPELRQMVLFDRTAAGPPFGFLNVLNEQGDVIADLHAATPRVGSWGNRDYFQEHKRNPRDQLYVARPVMTALGPPALLPLSRRLSHPDGSFAGVVVGSLRLGPVQELLSRFDPGPNGSLAVLRDDGVVLARVPADPNDLGRTLPASAGLFLRRPLVEAPDPLDRVIRLTAYRPVGAWPLTIAVGLARTDIDAPWKSRAAWFAAATAGLALLQLALIRLVAQAADRQSRAETEAAEAAASRSRLLATMSHELRTPLTAVLGYAELLAADETLRPDQAGLLGALSVAGAHMRDVIDRVIDITRDRPLDVPPMPAPVLLSDLVTQCRVVIEPETTARGLDLRWEIDPTLPRAVGVDSRQLCLVLINLLSNAAKYTRRGAVTLRLSGSADRLRCEVIDTGPGIPATLRRRLFHAYDRLDAPLPPAGGSGLGLAIAARLVRGMDGTIGHADAPGGGSLFWIEVPVTRVAAPVPAHRPPETEETGPALTLLLVEDNATNRDVTARFLGQAGHRVIPVSGGAEALKALEADEVDLVITDLRMPEMNGMSLAQAIRSLPGQRGRTPIMLLTADALARQAPGWSAAEIDLVVTKPFARTELLAAIRHAAGLRRPSQSGSALGETTAATEAPRPPGSAAMARTRLAGAEVPGARSPNIPAASDGKAPERPRAPPLLDEAISADVARALGEAGFADHVRLLAGRIGDLVALLRAGAAADPVALGDQAHETAGAAGIMGLLVLSFALREAVLAQRFDDPALIPLCESSLSALRRSAATRASAPVAQ